MPHLCHLCCSFILVLRSPFRCNETSHYLKLSNSTCVCFSVGFPVRCHSRKAKKTKVHRANTREIKNTAAKKWNGFPNDTVHYKYRILNSLHLRQKPYLWNGELSLFLYLCLITTTKSYPLSITSCVCAVRKGFKVRNPVIGTYPACDVDTCFVIEPCSTLCCLRRLILLRMSS